MTQRTLIGIFSLLVIATVLYMYATNQQPPDIVLALLGFVLHQVFGIDLDTALDAVTKAQAVTSGAGASAPHVVASAKHSPAPSGAGASASAADSLPT
jgi:hypothetical protein